MVGGGENTRETETPATKSVCVWEGGDGRETNSYQLFKNTTKWYISVWINQCNSLKAFYENLD